jgi:hypothetical protein
MRGRPLERDGLMLGMSVAVFPKGERVGWAGRLAKENNRFVMLKLFGSRRGRLFWLQRRPTLVLIETSRWLEMGKIGAWQRAGFPGVVTLSAGGCIEPRQGNPDAPTTPACRAQTADRSEAMVGRFGGEVLNPDDLEELQDAFG